MANGQLDTVLRHLHRLTDDGRLEELTDGQLLRAFAARQEEEAFAALVRRHGPLVFGVCRRILHDNHRAEDAFQATFLVLFRRARALDRRRSVAGWLYTVAYHVALRARAHVARRQRRERQVAHMPQAESHAEEIWHDLRPILDEELNNLPDHHRTAVLLCCLEGKTTDEAARLLGCPAGTVKSRLARARDRLRARLIRRGITLPATLLGAVLAERATAAVPPRLAEATVRTILLVATGKAMLPVTALAEGVLKMMLVTKLKNASALVLAVAVLVCGAGAITSQTLFPGPTEAPPAGHTPTVELVLDDRQPAAPENDAVAPPRPEAGKTVVAGQVCGADGKPVADARVAVVAGTYNRGASRLWIDEPNVVGQTRTDADGRYHLGVPRVSPNTHYLVKVFAAAPGHGLSGACLDPEVDAQALPIRLRQEQVIHVRLLDLQGVAAASVSVHVADVRTQPQEKERCFSLPPQGFALWPGSQKSDEQGRLTFRGLGRGTRVVLEIRADRFARQSRTVEIPAEGPVPDMIWSLAPAQIVSGKVIHDDTGKPVAHAHLQIESLVEQEGGAGVWTIRGPVKGRADAEGQFRLNPFQGGALRVTAYAPAGEPYLSYTQSVTWPKGAARHDVEIRLPRGVLVSGKITETPSGKPVAGAHVHFQPRTPSLNLSDAYYEGWKVGAVSGADGSYRIAVLPGAGHLLVKAPSPDYVHVEMSERMLTSVAKPAGPRYYPDAFLFRNLKPATRTHALDITLRRGVTVKGALVGPPGKPVRRVLLWHRSHVPHGYLHSVSPIYITDGRFEVPGCDPEGTVRLFFLAPDAGLGSVAGLTVREAVREPVTVRLEPCGSANGRLVDRKGAPQKDRQPQIELLITPGAPVTGEDFLDRELGADLGLLPAAMNPKSDSQGRVTFRGLIPGATYRLTDWESTRRVRKEFTVKPGETAVLGDILFLNGW